MASKNIQMNLMNSSGTYDVLWPETGGEKVVTYHTERIGTGKGENFSFSIDFSFLKMFYMVYGTGKNNVNMSSYIKIVKDNLGAFMPTNYLQGVLFVFQPNNLSNGVDGVYSGIYLCNPTGSFYNKVMVSYTFDTKIFRFTRDWSNGDGTTQLLQQFDELNTKYYISIVGTIE